MQDSNTTKAPQKSVMQTTFGERFFYGSYFLGQNIFYFIVIMMLQLFLTNYAGIDAIAVGALFLVLKIWDAINDPIFGIILDKVKFKGGKYIPWIRLSTFLIPLTTMFMFFLPSSFPMGLKWHGLPLLISFGIPRTQSAMCRSLLLPPL